MEAQNDTIVNRQQLIDGSTHYPLSSVLLIVSKKDVVLLFSEQSNMQ